MWKDPEGLTYHNVGTETRGLQRWDDPSEGLSQRLLEAELEIDIEELQGQTGLRWNQLTEEKISENPRFAKRTDQ